MKKHIKLPLIILTLLGMVLGNSGCSLDVTPTENIVGETYWKTENDAWYFLNTIYRKTTPGMGAYGDAYSGDCYIQYEWESQGMYYLQDGVSAATDNATNWNFENIRRVNLFLDNVDNCDMKEDMRERMKAEARFFRALNYLGKTISNGKVPIITEVLNYDHESIARDEVDKVRAFVLEEFKAAAAVLPESYKGGKMYEKGRVTKYAAKAYMARAALYFGEYELAESLTNEIIQSGEYDLFTISALTASQQKESDEMDIYIDFKDLNIDKDKFVKGMFSYESLWHDDHANNDNPEYIFSRQYTDVDENRDWTRYTAMRPSQMGGWSSVTPTQLLVDAYWSVDGKKPNIPTIEKRKDAYKVIAADLTEFLSKDKALTFSDFCKEKIAAGSLKNYEYIKEFRNRDSRLYASILLPFKGWFETDMGENFYYRWIKGGNNESKTGFNFRKSVALTQDAGNNGDSSADYPSFRYAEVLLIYAEARTENKGFDSEAQKQLNRLRDRCGMPNVPASLGKEAGLDLIRNERRIELSSEGRRVEDISRYEDSYWNGVFSGDLTMPDGEKILTMKWSSRMRLRPIPQSAIDKNGLLDQNPGY